MSKGLLLGIDLGTTVLKVGLFDGTTGALVATASRRLKVETFSHGGREEDPSAVLRSLRAVLRSVRLHAGSQWDAVCGVGLAAQGGSSILVERESGKAFTPMVLWNDGRTHAYDAQILDMSGMPYWRRRTWREVPPAGLGRLLWMRETHPELFHGGTLHVGAGEFAFHHLTGVWRQDPGHAIQIGAYNAQRGALTQGPFDLVGLPLSFVAPMRAGHETAQLSEGAARRFGLRAGIPVAGPYIDQEAAYLSSLGKVKNPLQCSLGTAWVGNFVLPQKLRGHSPYQLTLPNPNGAGYLVIQPLLTGNTSWDWAIKNFVHRDMMAGLRRAEKMLEDTPLPPDGLCMIPWLAQANPFNTTHHGGGTFSGVGVDTAREDLVRAVASGMTYELRRSLDAVAGRGVCDGVVLNGGASAGVHFQRMIATLFAPLPVYRHVDENAAVARGAVYTLNRRVACAPVKRCTPYTAVTQARVRAAYGHYVKTWEQCYGAVRAGGAYVIEECVR
ncbi:MAG: FGGY-family carbohydrate kinase [Candidatus Hydrogenedentes bacterium]|nr:FGGY-family carbohydrate kinase [Candidatus Hydrogenedentota bacterium]